ncbi:MAG: MarR family winged helix-turn-helix transcriptional regulator [Acidobacteriota bacterium]
MKPPKTQADKDPDVLAFGDFLEAFRGLEKALAADLKRRTGMPHKWFDALIRIAMESKKAIPMAELCAGTGLTSGGATRLVDRLEEVGYVKRVGLPSDRRVQLAALTEKGAEALDAAAVVHGENIRQHFTGKLSGEELELLLGLLRRIQEA